MDNARRNQMLTDAPLAPGPNILSSPNINTSRRNSQSNNSLQSFDSVSSVLQQQHPSLMVKMTHRNTNLFPMDQVQSLDPLDPPTSASYRQSKDIGHHVTEIGALGPLRSPVSDAVESNAMIRSTANGSPVSPVADFYRQQVLCYNSAPYIFTSLNTYFGANTTLTLTLPSLYP